ncbi:basic leucine zipper 8-like [Phoenix dactylifera]|uniref:Basic leucine zipper 8-like n=1 Tax=Phoenix dactylifera TaxID=42345 RepID=A0A8B8J830_PHODC|nr:basic leucine zipper 8-like [Phoenix dactylifera]
MLSLDEIFSFPFPAFDEGSGSTSWAEPAQTTETGPEEPDRAALSLAEERRRRRKISNRESARRSRMRKQRHLEELRSLGAQLRSENRSLADRLVATVDRCLIFRHENNRLLAESAALRRRLSDLLLLRQHHLLSSPPPPPPSSSPPPPPAVPAAWLIA